MRYSINDARRLENEAFIYGLTGLELLSDYDAVVRDCNGIGADWMPPSMTKVCTKLNPVMDLINSSLLCSKISF